MQVQQAVPNILAGMLIAIMNVTVAISVAALVFASTTPAFFASGIVVLLVGTLVVGLGGTLTSGFGGVICAPRSGLAPVFAAIVMGVFASTYVAESPSIALSTILATIVVTSTATGLFLVLLGKLKLGNLVRYIPFPVMGGLFSGIGYLFVRGGWSVAAGQSPSLALLDDTHGLILGLPAVVFAVCLYVAQARVDHWATFPGLLALGFTMFYTIFLTQGVDLETAALDGWFPIVASAPNLMLPVFDPRDLAQVDWGAIAGQSGSILLASILSAIFLLLDVSGIELIVRRELNPNDELKSMGYTNMLSGILGGYPGVHAASDTAFAFKLRGDSRLMGFVYAGTVALTILVGTGFIVSIPTFILGGLLIYLGIDFLIDWAWKMRRELPATDYGVVLLILVVIAATDILRGVAFGLGVSIVLFVIDYSKLNVVRNSVTGRDRASHIEYDLALREGLTDECDRILILNLQGFIFFGTADKLMRQIRTWTVDVGGKVDFLVLDFQRVSALDTSAVRSFSKLGYMSDASGYHVLITGADDKAIERLRTVGFFTDGANTPKRLHFQQLDDGIAWCERMIIEEIGVTETKGNTSLPKMLAQILSADVAPTLLSYFVEERHSTGAYLFREGDPGDALFIVGSGAVDVMIALEDGGEHVLRKLQAGTVLGEMALYTGAPRSASVRINQDALLYRLDADELRRMQLEHPEEMGRLHTYIVQLLAERLNRSTRELRRHI